MQGKALVKDAGCPGAFSLRRIEAACVPYNEASMHLLEKVGFRREGFARQYLCINGTWQDHVLYALLRDDFREVTGSP